MKHPSTHRFVAVSLWFLALLLTFAMTSWRIHSVHQEAESLLATQASQIAEQIANLLSTPGYALDDTTARPIVFTAMKNSSLYAIKVFSEEGLLEGQRRGAQGELEPWDGILLEKTVQAICPVDDPVTNRKIGTIEVYFRAAKALDYVDDVVFQETIRMLLTFVFVSLCLGLFFWKYADLRLEALPLLVRLRKNKNSGQSSTEDILQELVTKEKNKNIIDLDEGRSHINKTQDAMNVPAALFGQVFSHTPEILARLAADESEKEIVHLGQLLAEAAPCIGASRLHESALAMQKEISSQSKEMHRAIVECQKNLEEVLELLPPKAAA